MVFCSVFWDIGPIPLFIHFNKPPIEGDQLPVETHRVHYVSIKTNTSPIITSETITNCVMCVLFYSTLHVIKACKGSQRPGASCIKLYVDFNLKVYVCTKARFCLRTKVFRFIKACVRQNMRKNPLINPSQGKIVRTCISTPTPPRNHHIWSLQRLVLRCITSSAYHFHAYSHPRDTMFNTVKGTRR